MECSFTYGHYEDILSKAIELGYSIMGCQEYRNLRDKGDLPNKVLVLRHDVDSKFSRAYEIAEIEHRKGVSSTYFIRVFSNEYNIFDYNTMSKLLSIKKMGHEIGYHAEPVDVSMAHGITCHEAFDIGKKALELLLEDKIKGAASHREATGYNNLTQFIEKCSLDELDIEYEAYDSVSLNLFNNSLYVTDGYEWYWRSYEHGRRTDCTECICKLLDKEYPIIYCLTHPNSWYRRHFHKTIDFGE